MDFPHYKKIRLLRPDYSRAGEIDLPIQKLCVTINNHASFATLSSCAGRMCLLEFATPGNKQKTKWLIKTHAPMQPQQMWKTLKKYKGKKKVFFLSEPPILHIAARTPHPNLRKGSRL